MSDVTNDALPDQTQTETTPERGMTAQEFNKAFSAREKAAEKRLADMLDARISALMSGGSGQQKADTEATQPAKAADTEADAKYKRLEKQLEAVQADARKRELAANHKSLKADVSAALASKVHADWLDVATDHVLRQASEDFSGFVIDGEELSPKEAIQAWLKAPENKRFLPAPATSGRAKSEIRAGQPGKTTDGKLSPEEKADALAAFFNRS